MKFIVLLVTLFALFSVSQGFKKHFLQKDQEPNLELLQVIQLSRHGERSPLFNMASLNQTKWQSFSGTITPKGEIDHFLLGLANREKYFDKLGLHNLSQNPSELLKEIKFITTDNERCIGSAKQQLKGILFNEKYDDIQHPEKIRSFLNKKHSRKIESTINQIYNKVKSFKIKKSLYKSIHSTQFDNFLLMPYLSCTHLKILQAENLFSKKTFAFRKYLLDSGFLHKYAEIFKIQLNKDQDIRAQIDITDIQKMYDSVICNKNAGLQLPEGVDDEFLLKMKFVYDFTYLYHFANPEDINIIYAHSLVKNILKQMQEKALKQEESKKFISYVVHQTSVNGINLFFDVINVQADFDQYRKDPTKHESCKFGAYINFELHQDKDTKDYYVKYVFNGNPMKVCGDKELCTLKEFLDVTDRNLITEEEYNDFCFQDQENPFKIHLKEQW